MYEQHDDLFYKSLLQSFEMYNTSDSPIVSWYASGPLELTITLANGDKIIYDHLEQGIRNVKKRSEDELLSEDNWRREFAYKLRARMSIKNLTQKDLAYLSGVSVLTINNYLNMKSTPSAYNVMKLANVLGCSLTELGDF